MTARTLRLALLTDIHAGVDKGTKIGSRAAALLEEAVDAVNRSGAELVVELGDRVNNTVATEERRHLAEVALLLRGLTAPVVHLLGNHDVVNLASRDSEEAFGASFASRSWDTGGWHLVFWQAGTRLTGRGFVAPRKDLEWLRGDLDATAFPSVVFSHLPFSDASMAGNFYFERYPPGAAGYRNAAAVRALVAACPAAVLAVAGHVHWNSWHCVEGIHHLTVQSLTESFCTPPEPAGAWALLELSLDALRLETFGRDPVTLRLPLRPRGQRWLPPMEPVFPP